MKKLMNSPNQILHQKVKTNYLKLNWKLIKIIQSELKKIQTNYQINSFSNLIMKKQKFIMIKMQLTTNYKYIIQEWIKLTK